ncbi:hypothetical protein B0I35DRAFT_480576 [Stachybotrys elegans]|uniref:DUF4139 domain-containing protein n=1 Tax=Stachybotrys elegans TaxID=80388 RepID=A0A8K0WPL6_9HYPO|nr:hypothetical protein B0I35DRAFT_480576 [Stachybotrys elegans]
MADELHRMEHHVRDLPTRSVTLFPSQAHVTRELKDVRLQPGVNEIAIVGLTPTIDEHSVKVQGIGSSAIITDIVVELLPNRELFQDVYPDAEDGQEDEFATNDDVTNKTEELDEAQQQEKIRLERIVESQADRLILLQDEQQRLQEAISSATARLGILDSFSRAQVSLKEDVSISDTLETYRKERQKIFETHVDATIAERAIARQIGECRQVQDDHKMQLRKLEILANRSKEKALKEKSKREKKERLRRAETKKEEERIRKQREHFWPRSCYTVRITVEAPSLELSSSRRTSMSTARDVAGFASDSEEKSPLNADVQSMCNIKLSYNTTSAFWSPRYELALSTTTNTANLCFDASLTNMTSETWSNCKITLSNSQMNFSSSDSEIPTLKPWHIKLAGKTTALPSGFDSDFKKILFSHEERVQKGDWSARQHSFPPKPHSQLFGFNQPGSHTIHDKESNGSGYSPTPANAGAGDASLFGNRPVQNSQATGGGLFGQKSTQNDNQPTAGGLFGSRPTQGPSAFGVTSGGSLFGSQPAQGYSAFGNPASGGSFRQTDVREPEIPPSSGLVGRGSAQASVSGGLFGGPARASSYQEKHDDASALEPTPELSFLESSFEETGLTTTYDLAGFTTLRPARTASKKRVAYMTFKNIECTRTVVAKYKPAAYLEAKMTNTSRLVLHKGPVGLVLDGTSIGRSTLPLCSAGGTISLGFGVDSAIKVSYPKPDVRRSTSGLFNKEDSFIHMRTITLLDTRTVAAEPIRITVLDQVPVSEDGRLRVSVMQPRGLAGGANAVKIGQVGSGGEEDWGHATTKLKKDGEVVWDITLSAGNSIKLNLEYEVAMPTGESALQC